MMFSVSTLRVEIDSNRDAQIEKYNEILKYYSKTFHVFQELV